MTRNRPRRSHRFFALLAFVNASAFQFRFPQLRPYSSRRRSGGGPRALSADERAPPLGDHAADDRERRTHRERRRQRHGRRHRESRATAAGVESLFSAALWSLSATAPSLARNRKDTPPPSPSNAAQMGHADLPAVDCVWACYSPEEKTQLQHMKFLLASEFQRVVEGGWHEQYPDVYGDLRLLRFLRKSKERDVASSADRYRSFLEWREANHVDEIRATIGGGDEGAPSFAPSNGTLQRVAAHFPMKFDSVPGFGSVQPAAILYVGAFDTTGISEKIRSSEPEGTSSITLADFINYWIYLYESIHLHLYQQSMHFGKMVFLDEICDLSGLSIQQFSPYFVTQVMKPWLRMTQANYPETTRRIYVLHPPSIVNLAWKLVTPLLSQGTVDKIRFEKGFRGTADDFCDGNAT